MADPVVVVTGASSGIGRATAMHLADRGMRVFAGVRSEAAADSLRAHSSALTPLMLDVTDSASLARAAGEVARATDGAGIAGLVNNAGVSGGSPVEYLALADLRAMLEVNVIGVVATTQAFLPQLRTGGGRVVCIGSISGRLTFPFLAAYSMSKKSVGAICDSLRVELRPWSIQVSLIEPGSIDTPIWQKGLTEVDDTIASWPPEASELYGQMVPRVRAITEKTAANAIAPERVARTVARALTSRRPRTRYLVGADARRQAIIGRAPDRVRDVLLARMIGATRR